MANKGIRTDKFMSKAGDFTVIKPSKSGSKTTTKASGKSTGKRQSNLLTAWKDRHMHH